MHSVGWTALENKAKNLDALNLLEVIASEVRGLECIVRCGEDVVMLSAQRVQQLKASTELLVPQSPESMTGNKQCAVLCKCIR
jgi:hypothetical protein